MLTMDNPPVLDKNENPFLDDPRDDEGATNAPHDSGLDDTIHVDNSSDHAPPLLKPLIILLFNFQFDTTIYFLLYIQCLSLQLQTLGSINQ
mmetsp:Transcript_26412/g.47894  ORF Transcript_26412/g.47894 Transcript_26412/m.47894 type:complete len:91 (-) Transcript_26412:169-441(-)